MTFESKWRLDDLVVLNYLNNRCSHDTNDQNKAFIHSVKSVSAAHCTSIHLFLCWVFVCSNQNLKKQMSWRSFDTQPGWDCQCIDKGKKNRPSAVISKKHGLKGATKFTIATLLELFTGFDTAIQPSRSQLDSMLSSVEEKMWQRVDWCCIQNNSSSKLSKMN